LLKVHYLKLDFQFWYFLTKFYYISCIFVFFLNFST
jgi:hypothetical protein